MNEEHKRIQEAMMRLEKRISALPPEELIALFDDDNLPEISGNLTNKRREIE